MAYGSTIPATLDSVVDRKSRGAFFTPPELADFIVDFAIRDGHDRVLEPACGEAEFLRAAAQRLTDLGASSQEISSQLVGCEIHSESVRAAQRRMAGLGFSPTIVVGDFFDIDPSDATFSAVVGNPPYIRYQEFTGSQRSKARESAFSMGVRLDALASSWAPFVVHAARFLETGGRLGFVLPAEILTTNYAAPVRRFFLESFSDVRVILFERPVFPEVQEEVLLLCAEGFRCGQSESISLYQVDSTRELGSMTGLSVSVSGDVRWPVGRAAYDADALLGSVAESCLVPLSTYGKIHLGAVTGANNFFALTVERARELGLDENDTIRICPPGSRSLRTLTLDDAEMQRLTEAGKPTLLFAPRQEPSAAALRYIAAGEDEGLSQRYKCRVRTPWWRIPGVRVCDLFLTYMNGMGPNLCENEAGVAFLNSVHGLFLHDAVDAIDKRLLPIAFLSSVTLLSAELVGRSYGGGILKLEPREAQNLLVPSEDVLVRASSSLLAIRDEVSTCLASRKRDAATLRVDEVLLPEMGISREDARKMHGLLLELRARREHRGRRVSVGGAHDNQR